MLPEGAYDLVVPPDANRGVLALHPHPDMGGDRFHPVVGAVFDAAVERGWAACRFDLSSSSLEVAATELAAALDLLPPVPVTVVGYSFGAIVAARSVDARIDRWVLVAPPLGRLVAAGTLPAGADHRPKLLLAPAHDQFCPPSAAAAEVAGWTATTVEEVAGADHFLAGAAAAVADRAMAWADLTSGR
jgi:alpha/beta superfamily hydrolase